MQRISIKSAILVFLKTLGEASLAAIDEGFLNPRYSFTGPTRALFGLPTDRTLQEDEQKEWRHNKASLSVSLYRLRKDGLVTRAGSKKYARWSLTSKGKQFVNDLEGRAHKFQLPPKDGKLRIVCFDIAEKERWKRRKLRLLLVANDYSLLQKSLWIGDRPLIEDIFEEIKRLKLSRCIHIFEISKLGALRELDSF